jgi:protein-disulfide isomerase
MILIPRSTVNILATAILFFIAGYIVSWVVLSTTTTSLIADVKSAAATGASQAVGTSVAGLNLNVAAAPLPTATPIPIQQIEVGDSPSWGPANAKVTIVEFSDFECPYCAIFYGDSYKLLKQYYGDKVRFVFKDLPLPQHANAIPAALAAHCANEQNKFWEYHDILFENQSNLGSVALMDYAKRVGVPNLDQFNQCFSTQKYLPKVQENTRYAQSKYADATPTLFINGQIVRGAPRNFQAFASYLDQLLAAQ